MSLLQIEIGNSEMIGNVNIRQHRIIDQKCLLPDTYKNIPAFNTVVHKCRYPYRTKNRDTEPFGHNGTWVHFSDKYTGSVLKRGRHGTYGGDGYLVMLERNRFVMIQ